MVDEIRKEKGDLDVRYVDWSSDYQRKNGKCPVRNLSDFPVIQSPFWNTSNSFQKSWGDRPSPVRAWKDIVFVLDEKCRLADIFHFHGPSRGTGSRSLNKPGNYRALKESILKGFKSEAKTKSGKRSKASS